VKRPSRTELATPLPARMARTVRGKMQTKSSSISSSCLATTNKSTPARAHRDSGLRISLSRHTVNVLSSALLAPQPLGSEANNGQNECISPTVVHSNPRLLTDRSCRAGLHDNASPNPLTPDAGSDSTLILIRLRRKHRSARWATSLNTNNHLIRHMSQPRVWRGEHHVHIPHLFSQLHAKKGELPISNSCFKFHPKHLLPSTPRHSS
jgi:hypothetical protein